jgi:DNA-binding Xre family transcriptional regulator
MLEVKLDSLQQALETLEARFEQKEIDLQCLNELCANLEAQNSDLSQQLNQSHHVIRE